MPTGDAEQGCSEVIYSDNEIQDNQCDDAHDEVGVLFKVIFIYNNVLIRFRPCPGKRKGESPVASECFN